MFPLSHVYVSTTVLGKQSDLLVLGSVLPDIAWFTQKLRGVQIHNAPQAFADFVQFNYPELADLALGVQLHCPDSKGADFYSDDDATGYAKVQGRTLSADVARLAQIEDGQTSITLAHNLIEAAMDLHLAETTPQLLSVYRDAIASDVYDTLATCVAGYLETDAAVVEPELRAYFAALGPDHLMSPALIAQYIAVPLISAVSRHSIDDSGTVALIEQAHALTRPTYLDFLDSTVRQMRTDFAAFVSA
ncbi:MAG: hypothetical protein LC737_07885 [Chloroflexi bacterium]|nr:hypothetical protein [Chloroflexota bacterium]